MATAARRNLNPLIRPSATFSPTCGGGEEVDGREHSKSLNLTRAAFTSLLVCSDEPGGHFCGQGQFHGDVNQWMNCVVRVARAWNLQQRHILRP